MASIYKRASSKVWQASFYVKDSAGDWREVRRSTSKTQKKEAQAVADELERSARGVIANHSPEAENIDAILTMMRQEIALEKFTVLSARKYLTQITELVTGEKLQSFTIKTWCSEWIERKARDSSKATMARYRGHVKAFLSWIDSKAEKPLETLTTADVDKWKRSLLDTGIVGKTVLSYLKDIGSIYRSAIREGIVAFNPVAACEKPDTSDSQERLPFTVEEVAQLIKAAPDAEWKGLILMGAFTGLRMGDAARVQWTSIDLEKKLITVMPTKTRKKKTLVSIPINPDLLAYLSNVTITNDSPEAYVFPKLSRLGIGDRAGLSRGFVAIMKAAEVSRGKPSRVIVEDDEGAKDKGKGHVTYERGFHSLRHSFASWLRAAGVSEEDRMALMGHNTRDAQANYAHLNEKSSRTNMAKLPSLTPSQKKK
jgi:integrase